MLREETEQALLNEFKRVVDYVTTAIPSRPCVDAEFVEGKCYLSIQAGNKFGVFGDFYRGDVDQMASIFIRSATKENIIISITPIVENQNQEQLFS